MLDERKTAILRAVVEEYIETAEPVGSQLVASAPGVDVSSATVRNEMTVLEQEGFLVQPHTSAGRVPTDKGYRYFVDHLVERATLDRSQQAQVRTFFERAHGAVEEMMKDTTTLLASLTDQAAVVVGPDHEIATIRSVQLVGLSSRLALIVVVLSNGVVEKRTIELDEEVGDDLLAAARAHLAAAVTGASLVELPEVGPSGDPAVDAVVALATEALHAVAAEEADHVFIGGASRVVRSFDALETVRQVLDILEQQLVVVSLVRNVLDRGLKVAIGSETGYEPLAECSLVVSPYSIDGEPVGTIGVLGPTRMNYPQAMAAVAVVSRQLGLHLSEE